MQRLFNIVAETAPTESEAVVSAAAEAFWHPISITLCTIGLCVGIIWLFWFDGFGALRKTGVRRCRQWFVFWPVAILVFWNISLAVILGGIAAFIGSDLQSLPEAIKYPVSAILEIGLIAAMLVIAHKGFARRLKGFGLNIRTIHKDAGFAVVNLLAVFPLIQFSLFAVVMAGELMKGDFEIQKHQTLTFLTENGNTALKIMGVIFAVLIVPIFEEMLFRGFLQSAIRSAAGAWAAIIVTSAFFALIHYPNYTHMLSLFFLSCGLGYAYERSGSLLRPILMHIFFNGLSVGMTLLAT